jgi:hypothetical protein
MDASIVVAAVIILEAALPSGQAEGAAPAEGKIAAGGPAAAKGPAAAGKKKVAAPALPGKGWHSLQEGLDIVRSRYLPLLVVHRGEVPAPDAAAADGPPPRARPEGGREFARDLMAFLADKASEKTLDSFVCVEVDREALQAPYPEVPPRALPPRSGASPRGDAAAAPSAGERLGIEPGVAVLVILDYREKVVRRYDVKLPRRENLRRELRAISANLARVAAETRRVEKIFDAAEYSYAWGEKRDAVLAVIPLDDPKVQGGVDAVFAARLAMVIARWKKEGAEAVAIGQALEVDRRYLEAVDAYKEAGRKYPFPEIVRDADRRAGIAMRKAQGEW